MASIFEGLSFRSLQNVSPSHDRLRSIQISTAKKSIPSIVQQIVPFWQSLAFRCQGTTNRSATCPCYSRGSITAIGAMKETAKHQFVWFLFNNSYYSKKGKKTLKKHNESSTLFFGRELFFHVHHKVNLRKFSENSQKPSWIWPILVSKKTIN